MRSMPRAEIELPRMDALLEVVRDPCALSSTAPPAPESHSSLGMWPDRKCFQEVYRRGTLYRATGVAPVHLEDDSVAQLDLFGATLKTIEMKKVYEGVDKMRAKYGKHTLYLGSRHLAQSSAQHRADRGDEPLRKTVLLKGKRNVAGFVSHVPDSKPH